MNIYICTDKEDREKYYNKIKEEIEGLAPAASFTDAEDYDGIDMIAAAVTDALIKNENSPGRAALSHALKNGILVMPLIVSGSVPENYERVFGNMPFMFRGFMNHPDDNYDEFFSFYLSAADFFRRLKEEESIEKNIALCSELRKIHQFELMEKLLKKADINDMTDENTAYYYSFYLECLSEQGKTEEAGSVIKKALDAASEVKDDEIKAFFTGKAQFFAGKVCFDKKDYEKAKEYYKSALQTLGQIKDYGDVYVIEFLSRINNCLALTLERQGFEGGAYRYYYDALNIWQGEHFNIFSGCSYMNHAFCAYHTSVLDDGGNEEIREGGRKALLSALEIMKDVNEKNPSAEGYRLTADINKALGDIYEKTNQPGKAQEQYKKALEILYTTKNKLHTVRSKGDLAEISSEAGSFYMRQGKYEEAMKLCLSSAELYDSIRDDSDIESLIKLSLSFAQTASCCKKLGQRENAYVFYLQSCDLIKTVYNIEKSDETKIYMKAFYMELSGLCEDMGRNEEAMRLRLIAENI